MLEERFNNEDEARLNDVNCQQSDQLSDSREEELSPGFLKFLEEPGPRVSKNEITALLSAIDQLEREEQN